jgi:hypothetical protein
MNANPQAVRWDVVGRAEPRVSVMPRGVQVTEMPRASPSWRARGTTSSRAAPPRARS